MRPPERKRDGSRRRIQKLVSLRERAQEHRHYALLVIVNYHITTISHLYSMYNHDQASFAIVRLFLHMCAIIMSLFIALGRKEPGIFRVWTLEYQVMFAA